MTIKTVLMRGIGRGNGPADSLSPWSPSRCSSCGAGGRGWRILQPEQSMAGSVRGDSKYCWGVSRRFSAGCLACGYGGQALDRAFVAGISALIMLVVMRMGLEGLMASVSSIVNSCPSPKPVSLTPLCRRSVRNCAHVGTAPTIDCGRCDNMAKREPGLKASHRFCIRHPGGSRFGTAHSDSLRHRRCAGLHAP